MTGDERAAVVAEALAAHEVRWDPTIRPSARCTCGSPIVFARLTEDAVEDAHRAHAAAAVVDALDAQPGDAEQACHCPPCPGRGNDGHGMTHCAECCFGTHVEADLDCPIHGDAEQAGRLSDDVTPQSALSWSLPGGPEPYRQAEAILARLALIGWTVARAAAAWGADAVRALDEVERRIEQEALDNEAGGCDVDAGTYRAANRIVSDVRREVRAAADTGGE